MFEGYERTSRENSMRRKDFPSSPLGLHRVIEPAGALPQAAWRLDPGPELWPDEARVRVDRLNLDAASFRQLAEAAAEGSNGGGLGLAPGDRIATLVSLSLTPLAITDGLARWDGRSEQVPCDGHAILFGRSIAAVLPADLPVPLALAVLDVCGAPALTSRVVRRAAAGGAAPVVAILGAAGKSGSLSAVAARKAGAGSVIGLVPARAEADLLTSAGLADQVVIADARDPAAVAESVRAAGGPAQVTVVCVDVPDCEGGAVLATADGGTVIFFSMATSFSAAALGAEGVAADITMLIGNGYVPGHAALALDLIRAEPGVRRIFESRTAEGDSHAG